MAVLVAVASRHGATREIADTIEQELAERGIPTEIMDIDQVRDPARFEAYVLGSAVYMGQWMDPARAFVERHADLLRTRPTWLFSSGPTGYPLRPAPEWTVKVDGFLTAIDAREHRVFGGRLDKDRLVLRHRAIVLAFRAAEGDFRDWDEIRAWAADIASRLHRDGPALTVAGGTTPDARIGAPPAV
jgi:menaquinone-dependent protoporphyrinogen oxidase